MAIGTSLFAARQSSGAVASPAGRAHPTRLRMPLCLRPSPAIIVPTSIASFAAPRDTDTPPPGLKGADSSAPSHRRIAASRDRRRVLPSRELRQLFPLDEVEIDLGADAGRLRAARHAVAADLDVVEQAVLVRAVRQQHLEIGRIADRAGEVQLGEIVERVAAVMD